MHVDDAPVSRRVGRNIRAISLYSPLCTEKQVLESRITMCILQNDSVTQKVTECNAKKAIAWSCTHGAANKHPGDGPFGPLNKKRRLLAHTPITSDNTHMQFSGTTGDLAFSCRITNYHGIGLPARFA